MPEAAHETLLYVSASAAYRYSPPPAVYIYSYPRGKLVGEITGFDQYSHLGGLCSDTAGDVFVTESVPEGDYGYGYVYEYAHGSTSAKATYDSPGTAFGCAVDPTTGDLAVTNSTGSYSSGNHGNVAIFSSPSGKPKIWEYSAIGFYEYCTYDPKGDLFIDGYNESTSTIAYLYKGAYSFTGLELNVERLAPLSIQWIGKKLVVANTDNFGPTRIYEFRVTTNHAELVGLVTLHSGNAKRWPNQYLIRNNTIMGAPSNNFHFWSYPKGGRPTGVIKAPSKSASFIGEAISVPGS